jgi:anti-anti-sigma regulatory factor
MSRLATSCEGDTLTILVRGDLSFDDHWEFRACFERAPAGITHYVVDLRAATYVDGSALGMLLLLQDHAGGDRQRVWLQHANPGVREVLHDANFETLFLIA